jgi:hypothetical protein
VPHAFVIFMENSDPGEISRTSVAPFINSLRQRYGYAGNYYGVTHPSLPNYVAAIAGDFDNAYNDWNGNRFSMRTIVNQLQNHGLSWKAYMGGLPYAGYAGDRYPQHGPALYQRKHDPFMMVNLVLQHPSLRRNVVPDAQLPRDLKSGNVPTLSFISPDMCHDMHGISAILSPCPPVKDRLIAAGDQYLAALVPQIISSPAWKQDSVIFIVWDEGEQSTVGCCDSPATDGGGNVPAIIIARRGVRHYSSMKAYNHYSLLKTLQTVWKLGCLAHTCDSRHVHDMIEFLRPNYP